jgi:hypothetical protein
MRAERRLDLADEQRPPSDLTPAAEVATFQFDRHVRFKAKSADSDRGAAFVVSGGSDGEPFQRSAPSSYRQKSLNRVGASSVYLTVC